ncbi:MAG: adenosylcobinamide amidohydrolase [Nitrospirales bacterium]|nr:adenosylcobinamide amidohydrolase [Nitrospirales bacterium]
MKTSLLRVAVEPHCLIVRFPGMFDCVSWASWKGGSVSASAVLNCQVGLHGPDSPEVFVDEVGRLCRVHALVPEETIGLLTAAKVAAYKECVLFSADAWVHVVATIGLANARSVLDEADVELGAGCSRAGTVNLVVATNALPLLEGRLQAVAIAASAKTAAFRDHGVRSRKSHRSADVTGTDCIVVAASGEVMEDHCGLHTVLGEMIGRAVYASVTQGIEACSKACSR